MENPNKYISTLYPQRRQKLDGVPQRAPQSHCYDIAYRHALDIQGDRLAFGATTGNIYVSDDRGESRRYLGNNFPPITLVRFAPVT